MLYYGELNNLNNEKIYFNNTVTKGQYYILNTPATVRYDKDIINSYVKKGTIKKDTIHTNTDNNSCFAIAFVNSLFYQYDLNDGEYTEDQITQMINIKLIGAKLRRFGKMTSIDQAKKTEIFNILSDMIAYLKTINGFENYTNFALIIYSIDPCNDDVYIDIANEINKGTINTIHGYLRINADEKNITEDNTFIVRLTVCEKHFRALLPHNKLNKLNKDEYIERLVINQSKYESEINKEPASDKHVLPQQILQDKLKSSNKTNHITNYGNSSDLDECLANNIALRDQLETCINTSTTLRNELAQSKQDYETLLKNTFQGGSKNKVNPLDLFPPLNYKTVERRLKF